MPDADNISVSNIPVNGHDEMIVYPNPAADNFFVYLKGMEGTYALTLLDAMGAQLKQMTIHTNQKHQIPAHNLPQGVYYLKAENNGQCILKKLVLIK